MKIQCDVCNKEEALLFCSADEAALCNGCDHQIHHANKLANKHHRLSLLIPTNKDAPCCDVCQERRAFLFCREDRAILCRECDVPIHTANEQTKKHSRFFLTGVKLASCNITASSNTSYVDYRIKSNSQILTKKNMVVAVSTPPPMIENTTSTASKGCGGGYIAQSTTSGGGSTSSIAEYLIETLPGWHVEDFLDSSSAPPHGFCENEDSLPFIDPEFETSLANLPCDDVGIWVPQAPPPAHQFHSITEQKTLFFKEVKDVNKPSLVTKSSKRWCDHGFTVPQICPPSNKRCRSFWQSVQMNQQQ